MGEFIFRMLNNRWVVAIGSILVVFIFIVLPEIRAEIERTKNGRRPVQEQEE